MSKYKQEIDKVPAGKREPEEIIKTRRLKRDLKDASKNLNEKENLLTLELNEAAEANEYKKVLREFDDWILNLCAHFNCCSSDIDWDGRIIKRIISSEEEIPKELLRIPT